MKTEEKEVERCPRCNWRILDKVTPSTGVIELKCPNCHNVVQVDLSQMGQKNRRDNRAAK